MKPDERKIIEEYIQLLKSEVEHYNRQYVTAIDQCREAPSLRKQLYQNIAEETRKVIKDRNVVRRCLEKALEREEDESEKKPDTFREELATSVGLVAKNLNKMRYDIVPKSALLRELRIRVSIVENGRVVDIPGIEIDQEVLSTEYHEED